MKINTGYIIPALQYSDAPAAIDWLCNVLGFTKKLVVPAEEGQIAHAQLTLGGGMIMISSDKDTGYSQHIISPRKIEDKNTQTCLLFVSDDEIEAHYTRAVEGGAEMLVELRTEEYGGRYYSVRDPEGHLWSIGSYDPYAEPTHG